jgi:septal ring factor EnvC (AmiA/AmiB activator)
MNKKVILGLMLFTPIICFSTTSEIYKCVDENGVVSYVNIGIINKNCKKTSLTKIDKIGVVKANKFVKSDFSGEEFSKDKSVVKNLKEKENKRKAVLKQELQDEKDQLSTVSGMLKNIDKTNKDNAPQIHHLEEMIDQHQKNINVLETEINKN